ncbi:DUF4342 domain-containing protein [uncultured Hoeflea sp.]|uniref:DUF4342 domain-containing protein n=1 Tax=uncultured Hoeflea sp. TaxID=538666 RepID=UPI0026189025|nr:DUF4342 domain-containing protein [uncultured Hoeflea sp.]
MKSRDQNHTRTFTEEIEVMGSQLVQQIKDLFNQGNIRQLRIKKSNGDIMLETPLTVGVIAGGAVALAAPMLAILGAIAGFATRVRVEIVREVEGDDTADNATEDAGTGYGDSEVKSDDISARSAEPATKSKPAATKRKATASARTATKAKSAIKAKTGAKAKTAPKRKTSARNKTGAD